MLESNPGGKITTAKLAQEVGLSEAALYRHFPSKAKMIEGLIEFIEDTLFSRISVIAKESRTHEAKCHDIALLVLTLWNAIRALLDFLSAMHCRVKPIACAGACGSYCTASRRSSGRFCAS